MKQPVWNLELIRDSNAPLEAVVRVLADGQGFHRWHPRLKALDMRVERHETEHFEASYTERPCLGVEEQGRFLLRLESGRLLLVHHAKFKGWPVLLLMGWWRLRSHRMWERLVESL